MKKTCIVCGEEWNDWFMKLLGFVFRDSHNFETCQRCRNLSGIGYSVGEIREMNKEILKKIEEL